MKPEQFASLERIKQTIRKDQEQVRYHVTMSALAIVIQLTIIHNIILSFCYNLTNV